MKRIVVLGAGESGVGSAILAQKQGFDVFVVVNAVDGWHSKIELYRK